MRRVYLGKLCAYAWERTMHDVIGQTRGQRVARGVVAVAAVALPYLYVRWINHSSHVFADAEKAWLWGTAAVFTAACIAFAYHFLIEGPYQLWMQQSGSEGQSQVEYVAPGVVEMLKRAITPIELRERQGGSAERADRLAERHSLLPPPRDDGFRKHLNFLAAESAKRCPEMPIWKAVELVRQSIGDDDEHNCYPEARRQIRQAALEDRLEIWGRKEIPPNTLTAPLGASGAWSKIEPSYWTEYELNSLAASEHFEGREHTWNEAIKNTIGQRYWELRVREAHVSRLWHQREQRT
jgi:hypothetical protein